MHRFLILAAVGLAVAGMGITRVAQMEQRLDQIDALRQQVGVSRNAIQVELERLRGEVQGMQRTMESAQGTEAEQLATLRERLAGFESALEGAVETLEVQAQGLAAFEGLEETRLPALIDARVTQLQAGVEDRWDGMAKVVSAAATMAQLNRAELGLLSAEQDEVSRWRATVGPTVQLAGDTTVGSGVLLLSQPRTRIASDPQAEGESTDEVYETLLLTAWHVVRDIRAGAREESAPIPVTIYGEDGSVQYATAQLLLQEEDLDVAVLRLDSDLKVACGATLPTREHVDGLRIFREIVAVGCPLGNDPIPTQGLLTDLDHYVEGGEYWMISAPTYIGNSGGGIFDSTSNELLGIFSKIYTHGHMRPTVVPHMGLVTPIDKIYDWLEDEGLARLVETPSGLALELISE